MASRSNSFRLFALVPGMYWSLACLAGGCRGPAAEVAVANPPSVRADAFPAPRSMRAGFDLRRPGGSWRIGDQVLLGLLLRDHDEVQNWLLRLRVLEPQARDSSGEALPDLEWNLRVNGEQLRFSSKLARVEAEVLDVDGHRLGHSVPVVPRELLDRGMASACAAVVANRPSSDVASVEDLGVGGRGAVRDLAEATITAIALLQVVEEDEVLSSILWRVVEKPSIWSVVRNLGARVVIQPSFHRVARSLSPVPGLYDTTWQLPMGLRVNDQDALAIDLFVAEPSRPFALVGGLLGATARSPSDPELEFSMLLLSAKLGR